MKIQKQLWSVMLCCWLSAGYGVMGCGGGAGGGYEDFEDYAECPDLDGDGFKSLGDENCYNPGPDCDDDDADDPAECFDCACGELSCAPCARCINPDQREICGNVIDENCNGSNNEKWPCRGAGVSSTVYDPKMSENSAIYNNLVFLILIPIGGVIILKYRRRKK